MTTGPTAFARLQAHWVYGGALAGLLLLVLAPVFTEFWPLSDRITYFTLPAYLLHQYEEHDADRFRLFVNRHLAGGAEALTIPAVFWINILGVWAVLAAVIWLVRIAAPGWGVIAAWLLLVNALAHVGQVVILRRPNPGLWTALALFLPLGIGLLFALANTATPVHHITALGLVLAAHVAIFSRIPAARRKTNP